MYTIIIEIPINIHDNDIKSELALIGTVEYMRKAKLRYKVQRFMYDKDYNWIHKIIVRTKKTENLLLLKLKFGHYNYTVTTTKIDTNIIDY